MGYRKLKADFIFDGTELLQHHLLVVGEDGRVEALLPDDADSAAERHRGILMPGLINCHCHLELSHLKGVIPPGTGLVPFLVSVVRRRGAPEAAKQESIRRAAEEMYRNGIVAVADICNTADSVATKKESGMDWHNLVEVLNFFDAQLPRAMEQYGGVAAAYREAGLPAVLTPHAPYSLSPQTLQELNRRTAGQVISMHNQETPAENELFRQGTGAFLQLYHTLLQGRVPISATGTTSLQSWLPHFTNGQTILLVHNTFVSEEDIQFAKHHAARYGLQLVYCLCPNANQYIEATLPPVDLLVRQEVSIVLGTDSYSSNGQLNLFREVATLRKHFPQLQLGTLLRWATANGADALQWNHLGRFEKDRRPGVLLVQEDLSVQRML